FIITDWVISISRFTKGICDTIFWPGIRDSRLGHDFITGMRYSLVDWESMVLMNSNCLRIQIRLSIKIMQKSVAGTDNMYRVSGDVEPCKYMHSRVMEQHENGFIKEMNFGRTLECQGTSKVYEPQ
ncbi:hypothetical protein L9F63_007719, partial [Diploptera punctata]